MTDTTPPELPFVAPCRRVPLTAPFRWLQLGWQDFLAARTVSFLLGVISVVSSYAISLAAWYFGNLGLLLGILSGFIFLGPLLALALYSVSDQLQHGMRPRLATCLHDAARTAGNALVFAIVLMVVFLVWARAASLVHVFFPSGGEENARAELLLFLGVGSLVGACFAALVFTASAFSLPMMIDRRTDAVTAVVTSVNAVLRNKPTMLVWAGLLAFLTLLGFATLHLGFFLLLPLMGYASWHGYCETVDASAWPEQERHSRG